MSLCDALARAVWVRFGRLYKPAFSAGWPLSFYTPPDDAQHREAACAQRGRSVGPNHGRVVSIHDCFELDETVALVLEYAEGGSVADRLDQAVHMPGGTQSG